MAIELPGRRLLRSVKPRFAARGFAAGRRSTNAGLSLTSMIDFLVVIVVFLLMTFGTSAPCRAADVPWAENGIEAIDAPLVVVAGGSVLLDGLSAGDTREIEASHRLARIAGLATALAGKRALWRTLHPGKDFPGVVLLAMDGKEPALVVKSVFQTAALAGYPNVSFVVGALPKRAE